MILTPLEDIEERYGSEIRSAEAYERALVRCLTKKERKQFNYLYDSMRGPREVVSEFYDFACDKGMNRLFRYEVLGLSRILVPGALEVIGNSKRVLDIGCFDGLHTITYALNMPESYFVGVDLSRRSTRTAKSESDRYGCRNLRFVCGDVIDLPFRDYFDAIVAINVLHETEDSAQQRRPECALKDKIHSIRQAAQQGATLFLSFRTNSVEEMESHTNTHLQEAGFGGFQRAEIKYKRFGKTHTCLLIRAEAQ